jgi:hypothetical protein
MKARHGRARYLAGYEGNSDDEGHASEDGPDDEKRQGVGDCRRSLRCGRLVWIEIVSHAQYLFPENCTEVAGSCKRAGRFPATWWPAFTGFWGMGFDEAVANVTKRQSSQWRRLANGL